MEEELREEIKLLKGEISELNSKLNSLQNTMTTNFTQILERIVGITLSSDINEKIFNIGNRVLANKVSGISPGGVIKSTIKAELEQNIAESVPEPAKLESGLAESEPNLAKPNDDSAKLGSDLDRSDNGSSKSDNDLARSDTDQMKTYFIDNWNNSTTFAINPGKTITYKALLVASIKNEIVKTFSIDSFDTNPRTPEFIYKFCKDANDGLINSPSAQKYYSFIGKTFNGEFKPHKYCSSK